MINNMHTISCVALTKTVLNEILRDESYSFAAVFVNSHDNIFVIGDVYDFEIIEIDDFHEQYIIVDAGGTRRTILFHEDACDHGLLICINGAAISTTGIKYTDADSKEFIDFVKYDIGELGQECTTDHSKTANTLDDEPADIIIN